MYIHKFSHELPNKLRLHFYQKFLKIWWKQSLKLSLPSRNKILAIATKNYGKGDLKVFCFCPILLFFLLYPIDIILTVQPATLLKTECVTGVFLYIIQHWKVIFVLQLLASLSHLVKFGSIRVQILLAVCSNIKFIYENVLIRQTYVARNIRVFSSDLDSNPRGVFRTLSNI